ncbi:membrane protein insertion efficiency factor YidD [Wenjunlia tyrosinilytica]|uniref:Putative membrane protein insertion efficiency factor n=1 Tax=Wenjunlia tyrosinilytica TaxID=1544741 RepID=A0A917ZRM1_9ACTN|nr:membrane protein insertion efficiency factor YidD [Wenjunlia tyrosinilytica]GGO89838.1 hypothetical protein GCM10012280_34010 [Wenjunlia tyrosinilytica]
MAQGQSGCLGRRKRKKKKEKGDGGGDGSATECGCDALDCCDLMVLMQLRMLGAVVLAALGLGRTVRALNEEAGTPKGFLARRMHTAVRYYQVRISPRYGARCRYKPTCSAYAATALRRHGALRGGLLTLRRLARCNPRGGRGADPVPEA